MKDLTDVLEEIRFEYNLGYEPFHEFAIIRAIEIIKEHEADELWTDEKVESRQEEVEKDLNKEL